MISVVIPTLNGSDALGVLCRNIAEVLRKDYEIIIADDGSIEPPYRVIKELRNRGEKIKGVFLNRNYGQQLATLAGMMEAEGDYVITVDDDFSHKPEYFPAMVKAAEDNEADAVFAVPAEAPGSRFRRTGSGIRDLIFRIFFGMRKGLSVSSFRLMTGTLARDIVSDLGEYRYLSVEILKRTGKITNVSVDFTVAEGASRYGLLKLVSVTMSLIACSPVVPVFFKKESSAKKMEFTLI